MWWSEIETPIGPVGLVSDGDALCEVILPGGHRTVPDGIPEPDAIVETAAKELQQYFAGRRTQFTVPLHIHGTEFQEASWEALRAIPYGETRSYGEQALAIGRPGAARAVGQANRRNPLPIIVPCHRVKAADGGIGGYMGKWGGRDSIKQWLLDFETKTARQLLA